MAIQEQTGLISSAPISSAPSRQLPLFVPAGEAEWTATPMRPVATWLAAARADGSQRLEMVWRVPEPRATDAL